MGTPAQDGHLPPMVGSGRCSHPELFIHRSFKGRRLLISMALSQGSLGPEHRGARYFLTAFHARLLGTHPKMPAVTSCHHMTLHL